MPVLPAALASRVRSVASGSRRFLVLIYHRVLPEPDPLCPGEIDRAAFDGQVRELTRHFRVRPLAEAIRRSWDGTLEPATVCITFDDGYLDNVSDGLPILQRHGATATFFIASGYLRGRNMFNDIVIEAVRRTRAPLLDATDLGLGSWPLDTMEQRRAAISGVLRKARYLEPVARESAVREIEKRLGVSTPDDLMMTPDGVRELARAGMTIGGHTVNHPILRSVDEATAVEEIARNKEELEAWIDAPVELFAYPNGRPGDDYGDRDVELVRRAGYTGAVSTRSQTASNLCDRFQLPRFGPWRESASRFRLRMLTLM